MIKKIVSLLGVACAFAAFHADAACDLQFTTAGGPQYGNAQFSAFIKQQIRPRLTAAPGTFEIDIVKSCAGGAPSRLAILMDQTDYYLINIQGHPLVPQESVYQTSPLPLSEPDLEAGIDAAISFDTLPLPQKQNVVKILAYFLAESARFASIEHIDAALMNGNCAAQWLNYATLVRRWSVLSRFALHAASNDWTVRGGSGGHLIAPVSDAAIAAYDAAIAAGPGGPNASYIDNRDWHAPIQLQAPACQP